MESVAVAAMQIALMQADLAATRGERDAAAKRGVRDEAVGQLRVTLEQVESSREDSTFVADLTALLADEEPEVAGGPRGGPSTPNPPGGGGGQR
ncbi:hypothetical protein [Nocardia brasiliensis]|uniref:hypothetical protein n=1 Tax=Nocardia brasiliensis TaxID=37326 RepID=UPI0024586064|nr:hypothetical protein [Nocardia brasiliensis]